MIGYIRREYTTKLPVALDSFVWGYFGIDDVKRNLEINKEWQRESDERDSCRMNISIKFGTNWLPEWNANIMSTEIQRGVRLNMNMIVRIRRSNLNSDDSYKSHINQMCALVRCVYARSN